MCWTFFFKTFAFAEIYCCSCDDFSCSWIITRRDDFCSWKVQILRIRHEQLDSWQCGSTQQIRSGYRVRITNFYEILCRRRRRIFKLTVAKFCSFLYCSKVQYSPTLWKTVHLLSDLCSQLFLKVSAIFVLCTILKLAKL